MNQMQKRYLIKQVGIIKDRKAEGIQSENAPLAPTVLSVLEQELPDGLHLTLPQIKALMEKTLDNPKLTILEESYHWRASSETLAPRVLQLSGFESVIPGYKEAAKRAAAADKLFRREKEARIARLNTAADRLVADLMFGGDPVPDALAKFAAMEF